MQDGIRIRKNLRLKFKTSPSSFEVFTEIQVRHRLMRAIGSRRDSLGLENEMKKLATLFLTGVLSMQLVIAQSKENDDARLTRLGNSVVMSLMNEKALIQASQPRPAITRYDRFSDITVSELPACLIAGEDPIRSGIRAGMNSIDAIYAEWLTEAEGNVTLPKAKPSVGINLIIVAFEVTAHFEGDRELILLIDGDTRLKLGSMKKIDQRVDSGIVIETLGVTIPFRDYAKIAQAQSLEAKVGPMAFSFEGGYLSNLRDYIRSLAQQDQSTNPSDQQDQTSMIPGEEANFTPEELKEYYLVYDNPEVRYLRTVFAAYLRGDRARDEDSKLLGKWSKDYYRSKFVVLSKDNAMMGGTFITIIFQDRPDKVFLAWVYKEGGSQKRLWLKGFELGKFSEEDIRRVRIRYRRFLEDKVHAL